MNIKHVTMDKIIFQNYLIMFKTMQKFSKHVMVKEYQLHGRVSDETSEMHRKLHSILMESAKTLVVANYSRASKFSKTDSPAAILIAHLVQTMKH